MNRTTLRRLHLAASLVALLLPLLFFASTVAAELHGSAGTILFVKRAIACGLALMVPAAAAAALTGRQLAGESRAPAILAKERRTKAAALIGLFVLVPCALALYVLAARGTFRTAFAVLQVVELVAGPVNICLLALNARDGFRLSKKRQRTAATRA